MTTIALNYKKVQAKVEAMEMPSVNWKAICFAGFFLSLIMLVFYVWQINDLTKGYFLVNSYENQVNKLSAENKNLEVVFAENSFLGQVEQKVQAMSFEKTTSVQYIHIPANYVAVVK